MRKSLKKYIPNQTNDVAISVYVHYQARWSYRKGVEFGGAYKGIWSFSSSKYCIQLPGTGTMSIPLQWSSLSWLEPESKLLWRLCSQGRKNIGSDWSKRNKQQHCFSPNQFKLLIYSTWILIYVKSNEWLKTLCYT